MKLDFKMLCALYAALVALLATSCSGPEPYTKSVRIPKNLSMRLR